MHIRKTLLFRQVATRVNYTAQSAETLITLLVLLFGAQKPASINYIS